MTRTDRNSSFTVQGVGQARQAPSTQPTSLACPTLQPRKGLVIYLSFVHCMARFKVGPVVLKPRRAKAKASLLTLKKSQHHTAVPLTPSLRMQASSLRLAQTELEREMAPCRKSRLLFIAKGGKFRVTLLRYTPDTCHFIFQFTAYIYYIGTQQKPPAYELLLHTLFMTYSCNKINTT